MDRQRKPKPADFRPEPGFPNDHHHHGKRRCQAWQPLLGRQCMRLAVRGRDVCTRCGGTTPRGFSLPQTKTGEWSADLPTRMVGGYLAALEDPDLISLRKEIAVAEERVRDLLKRVDTKEAGDLWKSIREAVREFRAAQRRDDAPAAAQALRNMEALADEGAGDYAAWNEVGRWFGVIARLKESERRRLEAIQDRITSDRALLIASALVTAVRRNVTDRGALAAIELDFQQILNRGPHAGSDQPGPDP